MNSRTRHLVRALAALGVAITLSGCYVYPAYGPYYGGGYRPYYHPYYR